MEFKDTVSCLVPKPNGSFRRTMTVHLPEAYIVLDSRIPTLPIPILLLLGLDL
jgi:hypothetical protein